MSFCIYSSFGNMTLLPRKYPNVNKSPGNFKGEGGDLFLSFPIRNTPMLHHTPIVFHNAVDPTLYLSFSLFFYFFSHLSPQFLRSYDTRRKLIAVRELFLLRVIPLRIYVYYCRKVLKNAKFKSVSTELLSYLPFSYLNIQNDILFREDFTKWNMRVFKSSFSKKFFSFSLGVI